MSLPKSHLTQQQKTRCVLRMFLSFIEFDSRIWNIVESLRADVRAVRIFIVAQMTTHKIHSMEWKFTLIRHLIEIANLYELLDGRWRGEKLKKISVEFWKFHILASRTNCRSSCKVDGWKNSGQGHWRVSNWAVESGNGEKSNSLEWSSLS